jgi:hypothetical protein
MVNLHDWSLNKSKSHQLKGLYCFPNKTSVTIEFLVEWNPFQCRNHHHNHPLIFTRRLFLLYSSHCLTKLNQMIDNFLRAFIRFVRQRPGLGCGLKRSRRRSTLTRYRERQISLRPSHDRPRDQDQTLRISYDRSADHHLVRMSVTWTWFGMAGLSCRDSIIHCGRTTKSRGAFQF